MNKWVWAFAVILFASATFTVVHFGLQPRPVRMIKPGYVNSSQDAGFLVWKRLRHVLQGEKQLIFGVQTEASHFQLVSGVLRAAEGDGLSYATKMKEVRLPSELWPETQSWRQFNTKKQLTDITQVFAEATSAVFLAPTIYASHVVGQNPVSVMEKTLQRRVPTISVVHLVLSPKELDRIQPPCDHEGTFGAATGSALGCAAQRKSSGVYRKKFDRERFVLAMDQMGQKDFLIYLHTPIQ